MKKDLEPGPIVVIMEDELVHTDEHSEHDDPTCSCHGDPSSETVVHPLYEEVTDQVQLRTRGEQAQGEHEVPTSHAHPVHKE